LDEGLVSAIKFREERKAEKQKNSMINGKAS